MKFEVTVKGYFNNIKACKLAQWYEIDVECGKCCAMKKGLRIADFIHTEVTVPIPNSVHPKTVICNVSVKCPNCENQMLINVHSPDNQLRFQIEDTDIYDFGSAVLKDSSIVSIITSDDCVVKNVDNIELELFTEKGKKVLFVNNIKKKTVYETKGNEECYITNFTIEPYQIQ